MTGRLDLLVKPRTRSSRTEARPSVSAASRGYERLYLDHVLQADEGCDFDFLVDRLRAVVDPVGSRNVGIRATGNVL